MAYHGPPSEAELLWDHRMFSTISLKGSSIHSMLTNFLPRNGYCWPKRPIILQLPVSVCIPAALTCQNGSFSLRGDSSEKTRRGQASSKRTALSGKQSRMPAHLLWGLKTHRYQTTMGVFQPDIQNPNGKFWTNGLSNGKCTYLAYSVGKKPPRWL